MLTTGTLCLLAVILDRLLGEPRRWHPLVGFGRLAQRVEGLCNRGRPAQRVALGVFALLLVVAPFVALAYLAEQSHYGVWFGLLVLYLAIGLHSLQQHVEAVVRALEQHDLHGARAQVGKIVSRNTAGLDEVAIARAATESALENGSDALFAPLFWFALAGAPGVVLYRLVNTLDAMWGYRNTRFRHFGWAAARLDDLLNLIPARLTALTYALAGSTASALRCWLRQGHAWESPNAGPVMAAGAGALEVSLGGPACYDMVLHDRPLLGVGNPPHSHDIRRALQLVQRTLLIWLAILLLIP